ncbi:MAG: ATP-binding protein [Chloroflexi bacterium]|nr:MAG: ATP-binding protein [Chloroflexota bacterium]
MADLRSERRVPADQLTAYCDPASLPFSTTNDLHSLDAVFGQERAVRSIEFALGMRADGYNLYAAGQDGLGKATIVESFLRRRAAQLDPPPDWVYVHNFQAPDRPNAISFPSGEAREFAEAVAQAVRSAGTELGQAFDSDSYLRQRQELARELETQRNALIASLQEQARQLGFALQITPQGIQSAPINNGQPITDEQFGQLPEERRIEISKGSQDLDRTVQEALFQMRSVERGGTEQVEQLDRQVASFAIDHHFLRITQRWGDDQEVAQFVEGVRTDITNQSDAFRTEQQPSVPGGPNPAQVQAALLHRYEVNVLIAHTSQEGAPVVIENNPTYYNLIGRIDYVGQYGTMITDHTMIRAGSLLNANGGFIVIRMRDLLQQSPAYEALKRALSQDAVAVENLNESLGLVPTTGLRPEPIPLDLKVALIGDGNLHSALLRYDPDFRELFRVKADFDTDFRRTTDTVLGLASVVRAQCDLGGLRPFTAAAVARLVEHSSRTAEDQRRLSANMGAFVDLIRQSDYWAGQDNASEVDAKHVERALEELTYRSALVRDRMQQAIDDGSMFIATDGEVVGQVNALSVFDLGDIAFGRPSRITCVVAAGSGTIVNVERETDMAGAIHNKGFMILRGFLASRFGQTRAMSMHASMTFEQLYGGIDGDSASSTEIYAVLSALADVPISQHIAVTGSVNQHGEIQPIGGGTQKIEGFYEVCRARGLDGSHGVMLPHTNVPNIALRPEVAQAIADGKFNVWQVDTIEQGIEVLTGVPAGVRDANGVYPEGTVFRKVEDRLEQFAAALQHRTTTNEVSRTGSQPNVEPPPPPGVPPPPPPEPPTKL